MIDLFLLLAGLATVSMAILVLYTILFDRTPLDLNGPVSGWGTLGDWPIKRSPTRNQCGHG